MIDTTLHFKAVNKTTVALAYNVSGRTLNKWLKPFEKEIGLYSGGCYNPKQVATIVEHLGIPEETNLLCV
ncbi:DUF4248 domain-containing protein [Aquimarina sp. ERC-38]|uniref:hypothetical protein n=1 Tax=Aquimarina sp. ERC-38 TaxID=2949996 RepID=UPI0022457723|nr:hypothetical protein [Aquimarina sp. ERC-38]UZO79761.1 DUF4248 domain-containing protein [Aquimarina sp. ERC-38]